MRCGTSEPTAREQGSDPGQTPKRQKGSDPGQTPGSRDAAIVLFAAFLLVGCGHRQAESTATASAAARESAATGVPHGDHNPHHGGVVLMKGDLHYEIVLDPSGRSQLFFTDAVREDLPASIASAVTLTLKRPGESDETIALAIDDAGESWIGSGRRVSDPANTTATIAFTIAREPYAIEIPFSPPTPKRP
jgi:hypothetical protein